MLASPVAVGLVEAAGEVILGAIDVEVAAAVLETALRVEVLLVEVELEVELPSTAQVEKLAPPKSFPTRPAFDK